MDNVYTCFVSEDVKGNNQGAMLGIFEDLGDACDRRDKFNEKYSHMVASVEEMKITKKINK